MCRLDGSWYIWIVWKNITVYSRMLYGIHMSSSISVLYSLSAYNSDFHPFSIQFQSVHTFQLLLISSNVCCLKETCTKRARNTNTNIENEKKTKLIIICFIVHIYDFIIFVCLVKHLSPSHTTNSTKTSIHCKRNWNMYTEGCDEQYALRNAKQIFLYIRIISFHFCVRTRCDDGLLVVFAATYIWKRSLFLLCNIQ